VAGLLNRAGRRWNGAETNNTGAGRGKKKRELMINKNRKLIRLACQIKKEEVGNVKREV